jgi:hypothetical protein
MKEAVGINDLCQLSYHLPIPPPVLIWIRFQGYYLSPPYESTPSAVDPSFQHFHVLAYKATL